MDCLKPAAVDPDQQQGLRAYDFDSASNFQQSMLASLHSTRKLARTALSIALAMGLLSLALLGLIIWLAVDNHHNKQHISTLQRQMAQSSSTAAKSSTAPSLAGQGG